VKKKFLWPTDVKKPLKNVCDKYIIVLNVFAKLHNHVEKDREILGIAGKSKQASLQWYHM